MPKLIVPLLKVLKKTNPNKNNIIKSEAVIAPKTRYK